MGADSPRLSRLRRSPALTGAGGDCHPERHHALRWNSSPPARRLTTKGTRDDAAGRHELTARAGGIDPSGRGCGQSGGCVTSR
jgi:hypothetical protein